MADDTHDEVTMPDMEMGEGEAQRPPSVGWHPAVLTDADVAYSKDDMDLPPPARRRNFVLTCELSPDDPEMPGYRLGNTYIPAPTQVEADFHFDKYKKADKAERVRLMAENPDMFSSDGRTKYAQKMDWIKKAGAAFGGKESGKFDKNFFVKKIGEKFQVNVEHQEWQSEIQGRVKFMGLRPA